MHIFSHILAVIESVGSRSVLFLKIRLVGQLKNRLHLAQCDVRNLSLTASLRLEDQKIGVAGIVVLKDIAEFRRKGNRNAIISCVSSVKMLFLPLFFCQDEVDGIEDFVYVFRGDDKRRLEGHDGAAYAVFADDETSVLELL